MNEKACFFNHFHYNLEAEKSLLFILLLLFRCRELPAILWVSDLNALHEIGGKFTAEQIFRGIGVAVFRFGVAVPEVEGQTAHPDGAAGLPASVHPLWDNPIVFEIKHLVNILPYFSCNAHHVEKSPVIAVIDPAFAHHFQKEITVSRRTKSDIRH